MAFSRGTRWTRPMKIIAFVVASMILVAALLIIAANINFTDKGAANGQPPGATDDTGLRPVNPVNTRKEKLPTASPTASNDGRSNPVSVEDLEKLLHSSDNLSNILSRNLPLARAGDPDAELVMWGILDHCLGPQPNNGQESYKFWTEAIDDIKTPQALRDFYSGELRKCEGVAEISQTEKLGNGTEWLLLSAKAGQPAAEGYAALKCGSLDLSPNLCKSYLHDMIRQDPSGAVDLLGALATFNNEASAQAPPNAEVASYGMQLAKCELGADCSPSSAAMIGLCSQPCPPFTDVQDAIRKSTDQATYQAAEDYAAHIVAMLKANSAAWPEIRQAERIIEKSSSPFAAAPNANEDEAGHPPD